ncbi:MAG: amphi-Trp domain-containing protein [Desulfobacterales bacterium]|nr:amphi-Trp domain-containing protein [Desulfobacterales bacterium]
MKKKDLNVKVSLEADEVASYLESLAKSIRDGKVVIESGNKFISLTPSYKMDVEIEAKQKDDKEKISILLAWKCFEKKEGGLKLEISSNEPENQQQEECQSESSEYDASKEEPSSES